MTRARTVSAVMVSLCVFAAAEACRDIEPATYEQRAIDGGANPLTDQACLLCVRLEESTEECRAARADCDEQESCDFAMTCAIERGCLSQPASDIALCAIPCAADAGILSAEDPAVTNAFILIDCLRQGCQEECGFTPSEEGSGPQ